jgi:hypothetical protein
MPGKKIGSKVFGSKGSGIGAAVTTDMLAKINRYALTPLTTDQVFVRKFLMAHNCIDRDNECFPNDMLDQFAATMPGKSLLIGHNRRDLPCGKYFDASTEVMSCEQFKALTDAEPNMPTGVTDCKVMWAWAYLVKTSSNEELTQQIDGGVCDFCSIGFAAADLQAIRETPTGPVKYWQYVSPGEALEGSLVWLGAQPGAAAQKAFDKSKDPQGGKDMKILVAGISALLGKSLMESITENELLTEITSVLAAKDATIKALEPQAADFKAYKEKQVDEYIRLKTLLGEAGDSAEEKAPLKAAAAEFNMKFLDTEITNLLRRAKGKFPDGSVYAGKDSADREQHGKDGEDKSRTATGKKDFSRPENNELFSR